MTVPPKPDTLKLPTVEKQRAGRRASKVGLAQDAVVVLTIASTLADDIAALGIILPEKVRGYVAGFGIVATILLFILKRRLELMAKS